MALVLVGVLLWLALPLVLLRFALVTELAPLMDPRWGVVVVGWEVVGSPPATALSGRVVERQMLWLRLDRREDLGAGAEVLLWLSLLLSLSDGVTTVAVAPTCERRRAPSNDDVLS